MQGPDGMESSDAVLVARVLHGEVNAYGALVSRYRDKYARYAVHMLGNREDAEEALQDAFTRAYRSLARCEDPERFGAWLFRILVNRCRTSGARRVRRGQTFIHDETALLNFLLKYLEELGYDEMAEITGVGVSALKMRVMRACDRLRVLLREVHSG
jgi:RNA polymerase sigma-70 factor, ECF subfamily